MKVCPVVLNWTGFYIKLLTPKRINQMDLNQEERQQALDELQAQVDEIFTEAISNKWNLTDFAITIWVKTVRQEAPYLAVASLMLNKATGLTGDDNYALLRFLIEQTMAQNAEKVQGAVQLIHDGLIINKSSKDKN